MADPELAEASAAACDNQRQRTQEILAKKRAEKEAAAGGGHDSHAASNSNVFVDQVRALLQKDFANQKRQTGTNAAQILIPVGLFVLLYLLQKLIDSLISDIFGTDVIPANPRPWLAAAEYRLSDNGIPDAFSANYDTWCKVSTRDSAAPLLGPVLLSAATASARALVGAYAARAVPRNASAAGAIDFSGGFAAALAGAASAVGAASNASGAGGAGGAASLNKQFDFVADAQSGLLGNASFSSEDFIAIKQRVWPRRGMSKDNCAREKFYVPLRTEDAGSRADLEDALLAAWGDADDQRMGALSFDDVTALENSINNGGGGTGTGGGKVGVTIFHNDTLTGSEDLPLLINWVTQALFATLLPADTVASFGKPALKISGVRDFPSEETPVEFDLISIVGNGFYIFIFQLFFPVALGAIVLEKEHRIREIMKLQGLKMSAYFTSVYVFQFGMYLVTTLLTLLLGVLLGFRYYTDNAFGSYFLLLFCWGHVQTAMALLFSTLLGRARTATVVGYLFIFGAGTIAQQLIRLYFEDEGGTPAGTLFLIYLCPPFVLYHGLVMLRSGVAFNQPGIRMAQLGEYGLTGVYGVMVLEWAVMLALTAYFEAVLPSAVGVKKHPLFFLGYAYDDGNGDGNGGASGGGGEQSSSSGGKARSSFVEAADVAAERARAENWIETQTPAVRITNLRKCYPLEGGGVKVAVHDLSLAVTRGRCFAFLGSNGAGKTTTLNCVCGYFMPTAGTAFVDGADVRADSAAVHAALGVCPQDNILWPRLTAAEHLRFYGQLKGLPRGPALEAAVDAAVASVNLAHARNKVSAEYSGGMKRRLCVANALIGAPRVLVLDEPSTGLDPASRRALWGVIAAARKGGAAVLLTTHSLEEADHLADRVGIFCHGRLRSVGTPEELKIRSGAKFKVMLQTSPAPAAAADAATVAAATASLEAAGRAAPSDDDAWHRAVDAALRAEVGAGVAARLELLTATAGTLNWEVSRDALPLSAWFGVCQALAGRAELRVLDWAVCNSTLEQVFLRVTAQGEDELLAAERAEAGGAPAFSAGQPPKVPTEEAETGTPILPRQVGPVGEDAVEIC